MKNVYICCSDLFAVAEKAKRSTKQRENNRENYPELYVVIIVSFIRKKLFFIKGH